MNRPRAPRVATRFALALIIMLAGAGPVSARTVDVVVHTSSPTVVTAGYPVAYPVTAQNVGKNTLNSVVLSGVAPDTFTYLSASSPACSATEAVCVFGQVPSGASLPAVTFYYLVPEAPGDYQFRAVVTVNEGDADRSDDKSVAGDSFSSDPVDTKVVAFSNDFVSGYSLAGVRRMFSTGLTNLGPTNQHGSSVTVPSDAEVRVADVPPLAIDVPCPTVAASCFGWATSLEIGDGTEFPAGIEVTIQWDASQLPPGMTDRKLRIVHFDEDGYELVSEPCTFTDGLPDTLPCIKSAPQKQPDKDIKATILLLHNGFVRGW
jgi:uncharacterized repeat protein (TIGR01451 family)